MADPNMRSISEKRFRGIFNAEGTLDLSAGDDIDINLPEGVTGQWVKNARIATTGTTGVVQVQFYDGDVATGTKIGGNLYLLAQPANGFNLFHHLGTGTLGIEITGDAGVGDVYATVEYSA